MVLNRCVQEGSVRFADYCNANRDVLVRLVSVETILATAQSYVVTLGIFPYTFEGGRDRGIDIRWEARKVLDFLSDPTMLASIRAQPQNSMDALAPELTPKQSTKLCRRGALLRIRHSRKARSCTEHITPYVRNCPATVNSDWEAAIEAMKPLVAHITDQ